MDDHTRSSACVIIPMFNEAGAIADVIASVQAHFDRIVCVDDGSRDDSAAIARRAGADVVVHPVNLGQGAAIETGIRHALRSATTLYVVTLDADGQHSPQDAAAMVAAARENDVQVVLGSRFLGGVIGMSSTRRRVLKGAVRFTRLTTGLQVTDAHNGLRVLRRDAAEQLRVRLHGMSHASEILEQIARNGWTYVEHPTTVTYSDYSRAKGQPSYNALNILFDLAVHRLKAAS